MTTNYKNSLLVILAIIGGIGFAFLTNLAIYSNFIWWQRSLIILIGLILFLSCWSLAVFLLRKKWLIYLASFLTVTTFYLYFVIDYYYLTISLILLLTMIIYASPNIKFEEKSRTKISITAIFSGAIKSLLIGLSLWITLTFYYSGNIKMDLTIPEKYGEKILEYQIPGFSTDLSFDDLVYLSIINQNDNANKNTRALLDEYKKNLAPDYFQKYKESFIKQLKLEKLNIQGSETLKQIGFVNQVINNQIQTLVGKYQNITHLILVVVYYELIYWLAKLLYPLNLLFIWIIYKGLLKIGFIKIGKIQVEAEKIEI